MTSVIDRLYSEHHRLRVHLETVPEPSFISDADAQLRKVLLLSAASYFEVAIREILVEYFVEQTVTESLCVPFIKAKAIDRQYHTFFNWDANNANQFFGLFGPTFRDYMVARVPADSNLGESIRAFLELGSLRNHLVHRDFATFPLEKTVDEIYALYQSADSFVQVLGPALRESHAAAT